MAFVPNGPLSQHPAGKSFQIFSTGTTISLHPFSKAYHRRCRQTLTLETRLASAYPTFPKFKYSSPLSQELNCHSTVCVKLRAPKMDIGFPLPQPEKGAVHKTYTQLLRRKSRCHASNGKPPGARLTGRPCPYSLEGGVSGVQGG